MNEEAPRRSSKKPAAKTKSVEWQFPDFDRHLHEPIRLGIVSALSLHGIMVFGELKKLLKASDGNLSVHARRLEEAGYLRCAKSFRNRTPKSEYRLTKAGKKAFERYLSQMEALLRALQKA